VSTQEHLAPAFVTPRTPIDLTNCDREPIHIPGAIQPHGVLLAIREADYVILQASANAPARLTGGRAVLGAQLSAVLGMPSSDAIRVVLNRGAARASTTIQTLAGTFDATAYRSGGLAVIELEAADASAMVTPDAFRDMIRETLLHVEAATTLAGLAGAIAAQMRRLTGFDRVWVYRFHEDWHGEIIGESMREGIEPWLGLHYPASDIPAQARALFLKNWLRMIPDVAYKRVPLEPEANPVTGEPLDLANSVLRAVSPIHVEYLTNMGVTASLVISLIHRGQLWGLISGHHYSGPKRVPLATRTLCELLAQALSLQVGMAEQVEHRERALELRNVGRALRERLAVAPDYRASLVEGSPTLLDLADATGAVVCDDQKCASVGQVPPIEEARRLAAWLRERDTDVFQASMLAKHYPAAAAWTSYASGLLAVSLSSKRPYYIMWFRPERKQTIRWAGDPNKPATLDERTGVPRLSPRGSFALWEEEQRGTSEQWDPVVVDAAAELRRTLLDLILARAEEMAALNAELEMANRQLSDSAVELEVQAEELLRQGDERERLLDRERAARDEAERANRAKFDFLAMVSHELRTPLNAIGGYAQMLEMGVRGAVTEPQLRDLQRIQNNQRHLLGLINNILNFAKLDAGQVDFDIVAFDLASALDELESLVLPQLRDKGLSFEVRRPEGSVGVRADPEKTRQIFLNLLSNAIKFTDEGGSIVVSVDRHGDHWSVDVTDTGRGIPGDRLAAIFEPFVQIQRDHDSRPGEGIGLGLAISRDLARKMGGDLVAVSAVGEGSTFTVTLPVDRGAEATPASTDP
jgi:light-regulated signal transduction histidine kinase (bacteriophytochrome)